MKKYLSLKELQNESKNLLQVTANFLDKNNIKYSIFYGTLLGAVRHKGFIPWDDDIDIAIPRPDFNRLLNILKSNNMIQENVTAIGFELGNADWPYIKIVNKLINVDDKHNCDKNLWIDVFPLDGTIKSDKNYKNAINFWMRVLLSKRSYLRKEKYYNKLYKNILNKLLGYFIIPINYENIIKKIIKLSTKYDYNECDYIAVNVWNGEYECFDKSKYITKKMKFEDIEVNGLKDYDHFLTVRYGSDYMQLPPINKRKTHSIKAWVNVDEK